MRTDWLPSRLVHELTCFKMLSANNFIFEVSWGFSHHILPP